MPFSILEEDFSILGRKDCQKSILVFIHLGMFLFHLYFWRTVLLNIDIFTDFFFFFKNFECHCIAFWSPLFQIRSQPFIILLFWDFSIKALHRLLWLWSLYSHQLELQLQASRATNFTCRTANYQYCYFWNSPVKHGCSHSTPNKASTLQQQSSPFSWLALPCKITLTEPSQEWKPQMPSVLIYSSSRFLWSNFPQFVVCL